MTLTVIGGPKDYLPPPNEIRPRGARGPDKRRVKSIGETCEPSPAQSSSFAEFFRLTSLRSRGLFFPSAISLNRMGNACPDCSPYYYLKKKDNNVFVFVSLLRPNKTINSGKKKIQFLCRKPEKPGVIAFKRLICSRCENEAWLTFFRRKSAAAVPFCFCRLVLLRQRRIIPGRLALISRLHSLRSIELFPSLGSASSCTLCISPPDSFTSD